MGSPWEVRGKSWLQARQSRRWWGHRRLVERYQLRRPGRDSDEPGHPLPIHFHQDRLAGVLGFLELVGSHLGAVDRLLPTCCRMSPALQALVVGRAARSTAAISAPLTESSELQALARLLGERRQRHAVGHRLGLLVGLLGRPCRRGLGLLPRLRSPPILAMTVMSLPSRHRPSLTEVPGFMAEIMRVRSLIVSTFLPSTLLITSPT